MKIIKKRLIFIPIILLLISLAGIPLLLFLHKELAYYAYKEVAYRTIIDGIRSEHKDTEKIAIETMNFIYGRSFTSPRTPVIDKDVYSDFIRGSAWCDQRAWALGTLLGRLGIDNRMVMTRNPEGASNHTISEVYIDGKWRFFDPFWGIVIRNNNGELVSYRDICNEPSLFYLCPKMSMIKAIDPYSYEKKKEHYTRNVFYENPSTPTVWGNPFKKKDMKRKLITVTLDFYTRIFGKKFAFLFQDIYLFFCNVEKQNESSYFRARNYDLFNRYKLADAAYAEFINNNPDSPNIEDALLFYGILLNRTEFFESSIEMLEKLLQKYPGTRWKAVACYYIGYDYELLKKYDLSKIFYRQTIETYKGYPSYAKEGIEVDDTRVIERLYNLSAKP